MSRMYIFLIQTLRSNLHSKDKYERDKHVVPHQKKGQKIRLKWKIF
jgi:hypothetical protein